MPLKTDYKNDVLDTSKNTKRKYQQTTNSDGTISLDDVTVYSQEGSLLGANDINAITTRLNQLTANDGLDFRFATDGEGNYGYLKADDSFAPFKSKLKKLTTFSSSESITERGTYTKSFTYNCNSLSNADKLTVDDFVIQVNKIYTHWVTHGTVSWPKTWTQLEISKSYANKILTVTFTQKGGGVDVDRNNITGTCTISADVYIC